MSDRRYRQRGYQDDDRDRESRAPRAPGQPQSPAEGRPRERTPDAPRTPNLMANHDVVRCRACAAIVAPPIGTDAACPKCRVALHSCAQCAHFDPGAHFQCTQRITTPITRKDAANQCALFAPSVRVERQTSSVRPEHDPRSAFDKLFDF